MKIKLNEIPEEGRQFHFNREDSELCSILNDLVKSQSFDIQFFLKPLNSKNFDLNGHLKTQIPCQCSLCAEDFQFIINSSLREILIPAQSEDRTDKYARGSNSLGSISSDQDTEMSVSYYLKNNFDVGEFLHEAIALEIPFNPKCSTCLNKNSTDVLIYDEKMGEDIKPSPFSALKNLKLN